ncbi:hypothetical protein L2E82_34065 [Cichorium intybus]|uniref:Uncharacterized protein n=1 Tax=Cichorium intybus TaxID=13427 RepID=A0ACB9BLI6_CICIN|nr:hypothetical protein L2E82_34065 [Cichorium intybus]
MLVIEEGGGGFDQELSRMKHKKGEWGNACHSQSLADAEMTQPAVQLASIEEDKSLSQDKQQEINISVASQQVHSKPCPDLLNGPRKDYITTGIPLYEASIKGDWKTAKEILDKKRELVRYSITENGETALHVAASAKSTKQVEDFVENLMDYMQKTDLELENNSSNTALCLAAAAGNVKMVKIMVKKNRALVAITGSQGMTPLYMAALFGNYEVVKFLYENSKNLRDDCWTPQNRGWLLLKCVETDMFDIALKIVQEHTELSSSGLVLGVLAKKTDVFAETEFNIFKRTFNWIKNPKKQALEKECKAKALELLTIIWKNIAEKPRNEIDAIIRGPPDPPSNDKPPPDKQDQTMTLLKRISDGIDRMPVQIQTLVKQSAPLENRNLVNQPAPVENRNLVNQPAPNLVNRPASVEIRNVVNQPVPVVRPNVQVRVNSSDKKYSSRIIFVAAEMGNTRFIVELIRQYPDLIWKVDDDNRSIFHTAVKHRHEGIYNLLYEIGSMKDLITPLKDKNDNNMLHLVGKSAKKRRLEDVSGVALQMQRELLWFKEVEGMIPPSYRERKNKEGLTPHELFTREHKELVKQGEDWMKETASQCMVVAALIATIVFAAAFTVPGGYNQNDGIPFFFKKGTFIVFVVADAISLFSSSASILMFLSILTSRYAERDFLESLPKKLMLGLATLFLSITTMMIAFSVSFFVLYHKQLKWIPILISLFATMPVLLFATLQFPLLKDVFRSTYGSRYLFRPKKQVLYYDNSMSKRRWWFPCTIPYVSSCTSKILKLL